MPLSSFCSWGNLGLSHPVLNSTPWIKSPVPTFIISHHISWQLRFSTLALAKHRVPMTYTPLSDVASYGCGIPSDLTNVPHANYHQPFGWVTGCQGGVFQITLISPLLSLCSDHRKGSFLSSKKCRHWFCSCSWSFNTGFLALFPAI